MSKNKKINAINSCADDMLNKILQCVREEMKYSVIIDSAVVSSINEDGTVNIYFPPDNNNIFTKISNQTPFILQAGDSVEILLKNGSYSNCWIVAKHGATFK